MGVCVFFGAVQGLDNEAVQRDLEEYCSSLGYELVKDKPAHHLDRVWIYSQKNGWNRLAFQQQEIEWRKFFEEVSKTRNTKACYSMIYHGEYWQYWFYAHGKHLAALCSRPDELGTEDLVDDWTGNPAELARVFGVDSRVIKPYLASMTAESSGLGKVHPADQADLEDPWVMTDFLDKLGIHYPDESEIDGGKTIYLRSL